MKDLVAFLFGAFAFAVGTAFLVLGRHHIGDSTPLLVTIACCYLLAAGSWFPARMDLARDQVVSWYKAWKGS